jgi:general secretion pathway protein M
MANSAMSSTAGRLSDRLGAAGQSFSTFWAARDARERKMLSAMFVVVLVGVVYGLLINPALSGRDQLNKDLPVLRQQAAQLQSMAREVTGLASQNRPPVAPMAREGLESTLAAKGLKAENLAVSGEIAKVQLSTVSFSALLQWLDEIQKSALVSVVDANIVALPQPDSVNATLTLRQTRNE